MKLKRKYDIVAATLIMIASFLLGTAVLAAPKKNKENLPTPDYDSGWVSVDWGIPDRVTLTHNLGTRDLYVYIYYQMSDPEPIIDDYHKWTHDWGDENVHWFAADPNEITIRFHQSDYSLQQMRVLIWKIPS